MGKGSRAATPAPKRKRCAVRHWWNRPDSNRQTPRLAAASRHLCPFWLLSHMWLGSGTSTPKPAVFPLRQQSVPAASGLSHRPTMRNDSPGSATRWSGGTAVNRPCKRSRGTPRAPLRPHALRIFILHSAFSILHFLLEPPTGVEPASPAWEAGVLTVELRRRMCRGPSPPRQRSKEVFN